MKQDIIIEFENVSKSYKDIKALDEITLSIQKGKIFGYIGPNGSGKTTSIKIIVGLIKDFKGSVFINGKNIKDENGLNSNFLGYLPQETGFQEWRTVDHCLKSFGRLSGIPKDLLKENIAEVLRTVGILEFQNKKIVNLSGGMKQKLKLAQALLHNPPLVVLDEPLAGLDPSSRYQIKNIIKKLATQGKTIFFSSHILNDVQDVADQIGILHNGKIQKVGTPSELQAEFQIGNILQLIYKEGSLKCTTLKSLNSTETIKDIDQNIQLVKLKSDLDIDNCIKEILSTIMNEGCKLRSFNLLKPSLEEVYMKYAGGNI